MIKKLYSSAFLDRIFGGSDNRQHSIAKDVTCTAVHRYDVTDKYGSLSAEKTAWGQRQESTSVAGYIACPLNVRCRLLPNLQQDGTIM